MNRRWLSTVGPLALLAVLLAAVSCTARGSPDPPAEEAGGDAAGGAGTTAPAVRPPLLPSELRAAVGPPGIMEHVRRFQKIADQNGGNRAAGTPGYDASARYVAATLREAGYDVSVQRFEFPASAASRGAELEVLGTREGSPDFGLQTDLAAMEGSAGGRAEAPLVPVDVRSTTSGCEAEDFDGFPEGSVALLRRGTCAFGEKARNAEAAGASAVVISNDATDESELLLGTLGDREAGIPVIGTSAQAGENLAALARDGRPEVRVSVADETDGTTTNVIAETPGGDAGEDAGSTLMVGAHLDSVAQGPGINDNASGSSTVLEIAEEMARLDAVPRNKVRFAFWGAEELGLVGSRHYVGRLEDGEIEDISAYLNFDMVASPNPVRMVYEGPDRVEGAFTDYFEERGIEAQTASALDGRSDHGPFQDENVPTGGLFSGAGGDKTAQQKDDFGGEAGAPYDPCYHEACDDVDNLDREALDLLSDGAAHATAVLAGGRGL